MTEMNAAENLVGLTLDSGWSVVGKIIRAPKSTGGFFSVCYRVSKDGEICFLKAFNFAPFFNVANSGGQTRGVVDVVSEMLEAYKYERDLSDLCRNKHVTKVAFVRESGEQNVVGYPITLVPYLIFDSADGDVRSQLSYAAKLETAWKLESLHSVAVGLKQLHTIDVSHQDLKPSNVLLFKDESKIGDLGRSSCLALDSPYRDMAFAGDVTYAPPEILYREVEADWRKRSFAADTYMLGSLIVFYFSTLTMTALLRKNLPDDVSWQQYHGTYRDVCAYVVDAFQRSLDEFCSCIEGEFLRAELRTMVEYLCHPLPERRGHPKGLGSEATQHDLERVVSRLDFMHKKVKHSLAR